MVRKIQQNRLKQKFIKIGTKDKGGTMKIFGDSLNPSIPYKTFLLSINDTAEWVVKEMLEKYGFKHETPRNYCLVQMIIPPYNQIDTKSISETILHDKECPLNIYLNYTQKNQGSIVFKIIKCPLAFLEIRERLQAQELALNIPQLPSIQDRIINDHLPMFIEINPDNTNLVAPRVFKVYPDITHVGRDTKAGIGRQYFFIDGSGIDRDHCAIENQHGTVKIIPRSEVQINGKLIITPSILKHGMIICFGRNSTFRYYDPQIVQKIKQIFIPNREKSSVYSSEPILLKKTNNFHLTKVYSQQKKIPSTNNIDSETLIDVLPGLLKVPNESENQFLHTVFDNYPLNTIHFRLLPTYTLYMTLRYNLSSYQKSNVSFLQKQEDVCPLLYRIDDMIKKKIEECQEHAGYLAYWLANTSEILYFLKHDRDLSKMSTHIQTHLTSYIQRLLHYLIDILQNELDKCLTGFLNPHDNIERHIHIDKFTDTRWIILEQIPNKYYQFTFDDILAILSSIMDLLCKCRVNPAFTIQIFSQIFLYINTWLFNRIICCPELKLCSSLWGEKFLIRLKSIKNWAQRQGLELQCECYLMKLNQLCLLLKNSKYDVYDVQRLISNNTLQINSLQVKQILNNYISDRNEPPIANSFSDALLSAAYKQVDENLHSQGLIIQLAEQIDLNPSFLLPEDGYTFEQVQGIPQQLFQFIETMSQSTLCRLFINPHSRGMWTEFMEISNMKNNTKDYDKIETIVLNKKENSLGLNIVSVKSDNQQVYGIYIKGIIPNGAADNDRRLQPGDQILSVDNISLIDVTQEQAVDILKQCDNKITLEVLKDAANHHGLSSLLSTSSNPSLVSFQSSTFTRPVHQLQNSTPVTSSSTQPSYSSQILNDHASEEQQQSNSNLSYSKQFDNHEKNFIRSSNQTQSFINRKTSSSNRSLVFREDVPPDQNDNYRKKPSTPSKIVLKSILHSDPTTRQTNLTNDVNLSNRLSSSMRKQREPIQLINTYQKSIKEIRLERINDLIFKINRTEQEEKELKSLQLEDEFDRRVEEFYYQINENNTREISPRTSTEMNEFDEKLKRRLKQFEQDREIERAQINQMLAIRQARLSKNSIFIFLMAMMNDCDHSLLVWIDLEMSGLDLNIHTIVEIAIAITDFHLTNYIEGPDIVIHHDQDILDKMNDWSREQHTKSGLIELIRQSQISLDQAETTVIDFLKHYCPSGSGILAGNSVFVDRW
ncbi:unnamed protein product [Adineta steineri]|uniref:Afadin n=1 Tax=Adineta steineri TaxID=433720 RepID=A0A814ZWX7_9BILA|nr:unnamed protein product [Adineta steineri]CAF1265065.1 unnamed protein product [Adineta steineri]